MMREMTLDELRGLEPGSRLAWLRGIRSGAFRGHKEQVPVRLMRVTGKRAAVVLDHMLLISNSEAFIRLSHMVKLDVVKEHMAQPERLFM